MSTKPTNLNFISLEQASRCALLLFAADIPFVLWAAPGRGKSSMVAQLSARLKWRMVDMRGSDKESSDFAGIPYPDGNHLRYLVPPLIPWESEVGDERIILFLDEIDRSDRAVQNVMLQLLLDRQVNGMRLGRNVRVCGAGNGSSDTATTEVSDALATRCVHLYIESKSDSALESFDKWAEENGVSPMLRAYAKTRTDVWAGNGDDKLLDMGRPNPRTHSMADKIIQFASKAKFKTQDIVRPLVCGAVGFEAGVSLLGFNELHREAPSIEDILADPKAAKVPDDPGVLHILSITLADKCRGDDPESRARCEAVATYVNRFPAEQAAYAFSRIEHINPWIVTRPVWQRRVR